MENGKISLTRQNLFSASYPELSVAENLHTQMYDTKTLLME